MSAPKSHRLTPKELVMTINDVTVANANLSEESKKRMADLYERFRDRIHSALTHQVQDQTAFWIQLVGDMMAICKTINVPGIEKKEMLIEVINIVIENEIPEKDRAQLKTFVDATVSPAVELAIYFYNNQEVKKFCASLFKCKRC